MILVIFLVLLAIFVIVPVVGYAVWTMIIIAVHRHLPRHPRRV